MIAEFLMRGRRFWIFRWRLLRVVVGLPTWLALAVRDGATGFAREFGRTWAERPRHAQAHAAYREIVEGRYSEQGEEG
jgi:hypothetical protein